MYRSPITKCRFASSAQSPRHSTINTPPMESAAPNTWRKVTTFPKNRRPMSSIHTGVLAPTRVTLMGEEVAKAR